jgi:hypothetical protein
MNAYKVLGIDKEQQKFFDIQISKILLAESPSKKIYRLNKDFEFIWTNELNIFIKKFNNLKEYFYFDDKHLRSHYFKDSNNKVCKEYVEYFSNGKSRIYQTYDDNGFWETTWYVTGQVKSCVHFNKDKKLAGEWKEWDRKGKVISNFFKSKFEEHEIEEARIQYPEGPFVTNDLIENKQFNLIVPIKKIIR